jgi:hypothetical protein
MAKKPVKKVKKPSKSRILTKSSPKRVSKPHFAAKTARTTAKPARTAKKDAKSMAKDKGEGASQQDKEIQAKKDAKAAEKTSPYGELPKAGSLDPGKTTMANPPPQNVPMDPIEPTEDPMATPPAGPLPNPPSRPGGDFAGEPNVSPTGEPLDPDHPDYRHDVEGQHAPDHRSEAEKKANPRE